MEATSGSSDHGAQLFRAPLGDGEGYWARPARQGIENNGGTGNPDTAKATGATTNAEKLIGHGGIGSLTMPEVGAGSLIVYGFTAMIAHLSMSLGQTLFHRYLGHSRLGGRFFKNHIQFHHVHYAGNHVVSTHYLDDGDNNTLFFVMPVAVVVGLSYLFLRLDLLVVQMAVMLLSFCGHYYIDNQYHVEGSWLGRFPWFRRKQQLHFIHHRHGKCNFAVIDFFWDRLLGTYRSVGIRNVNELASSILRLVDAAPPRAGPADHRVATPFRRRARLTGQRLNSRQQFGSVIAGQGALGSHDGEGNKSAHNPLDGSARHRR